MQQDDELVLDALLRLARAGKKIRVSGHRASVEQSIRTFLVGRLQLATVEKLEQFQTKARRGELGLDELDVICGHIIFPPEEDNAGYLPVARLIYQTQGTVTVMRLHIGFFLFHDFSDDAGPKCIGIRFEAPEGAGGGHHDYYHAQFIRRLGDREGIDLTSMDFVPDNQPAIPLLATCRVTLLLSAVLAIYGLKFFNSTIVAVFRGNDVLENRVREWLPTVV